MSKPEDVTQDVRSEAAHVGSTVRMALAELAPRQAATLWGTPEIISIMNAHIARAIMAAEKRGEEREREACAAIIDANMLCGDDRSNKEVLLPRGTSGNKVGVAYAAAIRARSA